jgi:hypothetical protein
VVIALVGERGREVREFLHDTLGENRRSAIAIVSTGDESPMMRSAEDSDDGGQIFPRSRPVGPAHRGFR